MNILKEIKIRLLILWGKHFSYHTDFKNATATIRFIERDSEYGGSIFITVGKIRYYFEGEPEIEKYKSFDGKQVVQKKLKYGGWEIDCTK